MIWFGGKGLQNYDKFPSGAYGQNSIFFNRQTPPYVQKPISGSGLSETVSFKNVRFNPLLNVKPETANE